jgi:hypothetical protein
VAPRGGGGGGGGVANYFPTNKIVGCGTVSSRVWQVISQGVAGAPHPEHNTLKTLKKSCSESVTKHTYISLGAHIQCSFLGATGTLAGIGDYHWNQHKK